MIGNNRRGGKNWGAEGKGKTRFPRVLSKDFVTRGRNEAVRRRRISIDSYASVQVADLTRYDNHDARLSAECFCLSTFAISVLRFPFPDNRSLETHFLSCYDRAASHFFFFFSFFPPSRR